MHVFSFILLTAGVSSCRKKGYRIICLSWLLIDSAFEFGQKYLKHSIKNLPDWFDGIPILEAVKSYFIFGVFDYFDLISIVLGTVAAYIVLIKISEMNLPTAPINRDLRQAVGEPSHHVKP
jgi:hypothetical protein